MFRSATVKLTFWYILLATILSLAYSAVVYHLSTEELDEALSHQYHTFVDNDHDGDNIPSPNMYLQQHVRHLLNELVWFNVIVIGGSCVIGYLLARRTLRPIEEAHQAQIRFTAEASHELRTPLAAIRADTEVALMEKGLSGGTKQTLEGNLRDIERLEKLAANLLDIARYQNGSRTETILLDLDELTHRAVKQMIHKAAQKQVTIKETIKPVQVMGEQHALEQLIIIILDNAIKYSHRNSTVSISLKTDGTHAILIVKDKGVGIPPHDLPHVFEHFYRSQNTHASSHMNGYGLGLPLAQQIIKAHGGQIEIKSHERHSTTVTITLPIASV